MPMTKSLKVTLAGAAVVIVALPGVAVAAEAAPAEARADDVTYAEDVAPIIFNNCLVCHRPGQVAPMPFRDYKETRPWARAIKDKVQSREMPPWFADPQYGEWLNDRRLSQEQIDTIAAWVDAGAPMGEASDIPEPPMFSDNWALGDLGDPDLIVPMPVTVEVPADGEEGYQQFYVKNDLTEDKFIKGIEVRPGNRAAVHHAVIDMARLPPCSELDDRGQLTPVPDCERDDGGQQFVFSRESYKLIGYAPGKGFQRYREGTGKRISPGWYYRFDQHYTPIGTSQTDRTEIGFWFHDQPVQTEMIQKMVSGSGAFIAESTEVVASEGQRRPRVPNIPPNAGDWKLVATTPFAEDITLFALAPHMHLRGKDMRYVLVRPDGSEETLLSVPRYDFNWQLFYELVEPIAIEAGSKLMTVGHFDNSIKNRYNPAPDSEVYWAEQSWDEMFNGFYEYSVAMTAKPSTEN